MWWDAAVWHGLGRARLENGSRSQRGEENWHRGNGGAGSPLWAAPLKLRDMLLSWEAEGKDPEVRNSFC